MQLYYYELRVRVPLYRVLYVGLARSRSSSVFQYTVLFTGIRGYVYSCTGTVGYLLDLDLAQCTAVPCTEYSQLYLYYM